ncbi:MAG: hypothetical protein HY582_04190 [Candidatus Omnitrophica bacterium]|nr:hypothetical protein [Candidatus Omnitrophota bacterium]
MAQNQRKLMRVFTAHPPQRYFLILEFGILLGTLVFLFALIMSSLTESIGAAYLAARSADQFNSMADGIVTALFIKIVILFVVVFLLNAILNLLMLDRMTGPLVRVQRILEEIGKGKISDSNFTIRDGDYPVPLARALSKALGYLKHLQAAK